MLAMQYAFTLPADYDMQIIRRRVAEKGHFLDAFPGLGLKAYLIRERGVHGSLINQYAPFYLWSELDAMAQFLWGGAGFGSVVAAFGRPQVQSWPGVCTLRGAAYGTPPQSATRHTVALPAEIDPQQWVMAMQQEARAIAQAPNVSLVACGIDPKSWEFVRFTFWNKLPPAGNDEICYELLHLSTPQLEQIAS